MDTMTRPITRRIPADPGARTDLVGLAHAIEAYGVAGREDAVRQIVRDATDAGVPAVVVGVLADPTAPAVARERAFGRVAEALAALGDVSPRRQVAVERPWSSCAASSHPDAA